MSPTPSRRASRPLSSIAFLTIPILLVFAPARADWQTGGNPVCTAAGTQEELQAVADGQSGMLLVWADYRSGNADIYAQRLDADGNPLWTSNGLAVCTDDSVQVAPHVCSDGAGGAWIVWEDHRTDPNSLFAQHLDSAGSPVWAPVGGAMLVDEPVVDAGASVRCAPDGSGGVIVSWTMDTFLGPLPFATHLNASGVEVWGAGGVVCGDGIDVDANEPIEIVFDAPYTFLAWVWQDQVVLQRLDANGLVTWGGGVHPAAPPLDVEYTVNMCTDGAGGIIVMWHGGNLPYVERYTYAQRVNSQGQSMWLGPPDGVEVFFGMSMIWGHYGPYVVEDGVGGAVATWSESGMGMAFVAAQRLDATGARMWGEPYLTVEAYLAAYWRPQLVRSGSEFVFAWGPVGSELDVRMQRVSLAGSPLWPGPLAIAPGEGKNLNLTTGLAGRTLLAWTPRLIPTELELDVYATSLESNGDFTGPNLVVTDVVLADDPGEITVETTALITIQNTGSMPSGPFSVAYYLDLASPPVLHQTPQGPTSNHPGLAPGASWTWTTAPFRSLIVDTWSSWAFVDYTGQVVEADGEDDNIYGPVVHAWEARPNLRITQYEISETHPGVGDPVTVSITVENDGHADASAFRIDFYQDLAVSPGVGLAGDQSHQVAFLAAGNTTSWTTSPFTGSSLETWSTYAQVDTENDQVEWKENDNVYGPRGILWKLPMQQGWPVTTGGQCTSPAIGTLSRDLPGARHVVVGCLDGSVYALDANGRSLPGWPFHVPVPVQSSPALGNVTGDEALEVVFGADDGKVYCVSAAGSLLWDFRTSTADKVTATPVLADLTHDETLEIVVGSENGQLYALDGDGTLLPGWPVDLGLPILASPAAGEMDASAGVEIVAIASNIGKAPQSTLHVLTAAGTSYSGAWPLILLAPVISSPALGNIAGGPEMEIVVGDVAGNLHVWTLAGFSGPFPLMLDGAITTSPALVDVGNDGLLEIAVAAEHAEGLPPLWQTTMTLVDGNAHALTGWPYSLTHPSLSMRPGAGPVAWQVPKKDDLRLALGTSPGFCFVFDQAASGLVHYSMEMNGPITGAAALGDLDADAHLEMVVAGNGEIACYDLLERSYRPDLLPWPMFRHDMNRTGAYGHATVTAAPPPPPPMVTRLGRPYPNPFNPSVTIPFTQSRAGDVHLIVYDVAGRRVRQLTREWWPEGSHVVEWNGADDEGGIVASGVYLVRMTTREVESTVRVVLAK